MAKMSLAGIASTSPADRGALRVQAAASSLRPLAKLCFLNHRVGIRSNSKAPKGHRIGMLLLAASLAGCGENRRNRAAEDHPAKPVQTINLTGSYVAKAKGAQHARMCVIVDRSGEASFGIVSENAKGGSCAGAGVIAQQGNSLSLRMAGEESCVIQADIKGTRVKLSQSPPQQCAYYCSPGATLSGIIFEKIEGTAGAAMRVTDLAGDPLCG